MFPYLLDLNLKIGFMTYHEKLMEILEGNCPQFEILGAFAFSVEGDPIEM